jgi:hypothetical protein
LIFFWKCFKRLILKTQNVVFALEMSLLRKSKLIHNLGAISFTKDLQFCPGINISSLHLPLILKPTPRKYSMRTNNLKKGGTS